MIESKCYSNIFSLHGGCCSTNINFVYTCIITVSQLLLLILFTHVLLLFHSGCILAIFVYTCIITLILLCLRFMNFNFLRSTCDILSGPKWGDVCV